ncbi:leukemia NUP98 fusion partner 1 [Trichosurus vulpecula]|uniref:leukemia NUP98 fusion partner 1 n=1 Tax=Trichosurus vulpecula TaxID=9337 RepID=UPI00186ACBD6|nr:leukemia NUP98 fusion partner 1 [Trichosurus vulpecula]
MENEDDDDVSFAKWMSSFWGHSWIDENERELRNHRERRAQDIRNRRTSLPCPTQFAALPMSTVHGPSMVVPVSGHPRRHSHEDQEFGGHRHMRAGKMCSQSSSVQGQMKPKGRSHSIQEFSEHFEQQLCIRTKRSVSLEPEDRKERKDRERLRSRTKAHQEARERRKSEEKEQEEANMAALAKKIYE